MPRYLFLKHVMILFEVHIKLFSVKKIVSCVHVPTFLKVYIFCLHHVSNCTWMLFCFFKVNVNKEKSYLPQMQPEPPWPRGGTLHSACRQPQSWSGRSTRVNRKMKNSKDLPTTSMHRSIYPCACNVPVCSLKRTGNCFCDVHQIV